MRATKYTQFVRVNLFQHEPVEHPHVHVMDFDLIDHAIHSSPFDSSEALFTFLGHVIDSGALRHAPHFTALPWGTRPGWVDKARRDPGRSCRDTPSHGSSSPLFRVIFTSTLTQPHPAFHIHLVSLACAHPLAYSIPCSGSEKQRALQVSLLAPLITFGYFVFNHGNVCCAFVSRRPLLARVSLGPLIQSSNAPGLLPFVGLR